MDPQFYFHVGKVVLRDDECYWIFPRTYIYQNRDIFIQSPYFSYFSEKWRLVMEARAGYRDLDLYLWRESYTKFPKYNYTIQLRLETPDGKFTVGCCEGDLIHDYGFEAKKFCDLYHIRDYSGLIKIFFEIRKKEMTDDVPSCAVDNNEVDLSKNDENCSDGESSSENEGSSDEEEIKKKRVSSKIKGIEILSENLKQMFLDERMSDSVLKVDDREFKVHKAILAARSPVFASMFHHDLAEKKTSTVDIPDCTAESFEAFLSHLYSGSAEKLSTSNVYNVYYAADKYRVDDLKKKCVKFMKKNIPQETFCNTIALSLRHGESKLQKIAVRFFSDNIKKIIKTVQWQKYMEENPTQANELLIKALNA